MCTVCRRQSHYLVKVLVGDRYKNEESWCPGCLWHLLVRGEHVGFVNNEETHADAGPRT